MKSATRNLTEGNPLSLIISFSLPLMAGNIFQQLYTVVDTMVVGRALGVEALAALGATDWLYWMMLGMVQGITQGFSILMAKHFGAGRHDDLRTAVGSSVMLSALCSLVLLAAGMYIARPMLVLMDTPVQILDSALLYLRTMLLGLPIVMAYNLLASILRSLGDGRTPLFAMIVAALTNIALDLLFVLGFGWGIAGAAAASLLAQLVSSVYCYVRIRRIDFLSLEPRHYRLQLKGSLKLMLLGAPMAFQNAIIAIGGMIILAVVNGYGVAFLAGFTATNKLYGILEVAATSYGYAMVTYTGQNLGAGKPERIRKGMRCAIIVGIVTSAVITAAMLPLGRTIVGSFISGTANETAQAIDAAYTYLAIMSICLPVLYILHITRSTVQGMGNTVLPMISGIAEFVMRTGGVLLLPALIGQNGIFIAEVSAWAGADIILIPSYFYMISRTERKLREGKELSQ